MKRTVTALIILLSSNANSESLPYVKGELIVRYDVGVSEKVKDEGVGASGGVIKKRESITSQVDVLQLSNGVSVEEAIEEMAYDPAVVACSPNYIIRTDAGIFPPDEDTSVPEDDPRFSDPLFYRSYGIRKIGSVLTWDAFTLGNQEMVVAVIDSGIDYQHEDLSANMWKNKAETPGNGIDDDENGYVDDVYGWNFVNSNNDPYDDNHHGTHVAGTIGALAGNHVGTIGVSPKVSLMAVKFLDKNGEGNLKGAIDAISYAVANGAKILNNSWGDDFYSEVLEGVIKDVAEQGVLFVAAAGNWNLNNDFMPTFPASYNSENIISVAATNRNDQRASFSNYGKETVHVAAPGTSIYSTIPNDLYAHLSGTSMAAPHVSGAAALIWSYRPHLTPVEIKSIIMKTVDPVDEIKDITISGGRLNVYNALALGLFSF